MNASATVTIPDNVIEDLPPLAGWLYVVVKRYTERPVDDKPLTLERLATLANMSRASVARYIKLLKAKRLIAIENGSAGGKTEANQYRVADSEQASPTDTAAVSQSDGGSLTEIPLDAPHGETGSLTEILPVRASLPTKTSTKNTEQDKNKEKDKSLFSPPAKTRRKNPNEDLHHAVVRTFGLEPEAMTKTADSLYWRVAAELKSVSLTAEQVPDLYGYVRRKARDEEWSKPFTPLALSKYAPEFLKGRHEAQETQARKDKAEREWRERHPEMYPAVAS